MTAIKICRTSDVTEGEPLLVDEGDLTLAVYTADGEFYVTDAICTHGMAALTDGYQENFVIECPLHGGSFDIRSGEPLTAPCEIALKTYPVTVDGEWILVTAGAA